VIFTLNEREYQTVSIWIIRHGQSQSNAGLATMGPHENALSELGDRQSRCIPTAVKQTPDLIVTSPYLRTQLTAQPLIEQFPHTPVEAKGKFRNLPIWVYSSTNQPQPRLVNL